MLSPAGEAAHRLALLGWLLLGVASAVVLIVTVAIIIPLRRRRVSLADAPLAGSPDREDGVMPISIGVGLSILVLIAAYIGTVVTLHATVTPPRTPALTVSVTAHQWWWEIEYTDANPGRSVRTANEFHIPVGQTVRLELQSADVVHSFWVPRLQGKVDVIPGETNSFWIEADQPGTYYGQCAKYCGMQHAHMAIFVIADSPSDFASWLDRQREPAHAPTDSLVQAGQTAFTNAPCAFCHTIRGTEAAGRAGPDLTHLAGRGTIAAGELRNGTGDLSAWITNAPSLKPGTLMPRMDLDPRTLHAVVAYLRTLN